MTFPWDVPPGTVIIEFIDGQWRVVPHQSLVEIFATREEAIARANEIANRFLNTWRIIEKPPTQQMRRSA